MTHVSSNTDGFDPALNYETELDMCKITPFTINRLEKIINTTDAAELSLKMEHHASRSFSLHAELERGACKPRALCSCNPVMRD